MELKKFGIGASAIFAFVVFWGGAQLARRDLKSPLESDNFLNYIMPKLKVFTPQFSLFDRKFIDRKKLAPKNPDNLNNIKMAQNKPMASPTPKSLATAPPKPKAQVATTPLPNPPLVSSNDSKKEINTSDISDSDLPLENSVGPNGNAGRPMAVESPTPESQIGDWKMKILRNPTKETMNAFIFDFQTGKITKVVFYQVINDLMNDSSPEIQKLAVYGLAATPSYDSFVALMSNKSHLSSETQELVKIAIDGYIRTDKLSILNLALKSENTDVILGSMPLIAKIGSATELWISELSSTVGERERRGHSNRVPKGSFLDVVNTLNNLENSSDRQISQAARDTLNDLNNQSSTASRRE